MRHLTFAALALAAAGCLPIYASTEFSNAGIPIPAGLVEGDTFQLVFVTGMATAALSTDINYYNSFVNTDANSAAGSLVAGLGITWSALGSTASVNVLSNIVNTSPSTPGFGGIFDLLGNSIADGTETTGIGLYSGALQNPISYNEAGAYYNNTVWTGTDANGGTYAPLGSGDVSVGYSAATNYQWTSNYVSLGGFPLVPLYAISGLLELGPNDTLENATPEPGTVGMMLFGLAACYLATRRKRMVVSPKATTASR